MPSSALDDLGFGVAPTPTPSAAAPDTSGGDPAVWTLLGEAGTDPQGQIAVGSTLLNRMRRAGAGSLADVAANPANGYEAWQNASDRARTVRAYPVGSAQYQAAAKTLADLQSGAIPALPYDSFYSPKGQEARGRPPPSFEDGSGVDIGGNRFFTTNGALAKAGSALDDLGFGESAGQEGAQAAPKTPLPPNPGAKSVANVPPPDTLDRVAADIGRAKLAQAQADPHATWPFYDSANDVWRNKDGSIVQVGGAPQPVTIGPNGIEVTANAGASSFSPKTINDWMAAHPLDPASQAFMAGAGPQETSLGRAGVGAEQGLSDVRTSLEQLDARIRGNPFLSSLAASYAPGAVAFEQADIARNLLNRNANDITLGGSPAYQLGRFGGQSAAIIPAMIGTEGLLGAGAGALGVSDASAGLPLLYRAPAALAQSAGRGALLGGEAGALTASGSDRPLLQQIGQGAETGAALNPAFEGASAIGSGLLRAGETALAPMTPRGRGNIVDANLLQATGGPVSGDFAEYVPGVQPTLAEATHSPVLATTERTLRSSTDPGTVNAFAARDNANAAARENFVDSLVGDPQTVEHMRAARDAQTAQLRDAAFANKTPADATPVVQTIDSILASPAGQRDAVRRALTNVRGKLVSDIDLGGGKTVAQVESDPEQLYGIRQAINDQLSPLAARTGSDAQLASKELSQVKGALDSAIEQGAPGFRTYLQAYNQASRPIDALEYLQSLNLRNQRGEITLGNINRAVRGMEADRSANGVNAAKSLSNDQVQALYNLRADLQRADLTTPLAQAGRTKVVTGNVDNQGLVNKLLSPVTAPIVGAVTGHPVGAAAVTLAKAAADTQKGKLQNLLVDRVLNPDPTAAPLTLPAALAPRPRSVRVAPVFTGLAVNRKNPGNALTSPAP